MSDTYQAIYDAVRSRVSGGSVDEAIERAIRDQNWSHYIQMAAAEWQTAATEQSRPCVLFKPRLFLDGNHWCALFGDNIQEGVAAFGKSPAEAMYEFDKEWQKEIP